MGLLTYSTIGSLDGYIADPSGDFSWAMPDAEVHQHANDLLRGVDVHLYGRLTYALMVPWETDRSLAEGSPISAEFASLWQDADKVVYSTSLGEVATCRTRLERRFDPEAVRALKASTQGGLMIAGPTLAAQALRAGLVDVVDLVLLPIVIGGGLAVFPDDVRLGLELISERRFTCGALAVRYHVSRAGA